MNSTFRVLDATETNGKQGSVVVWLTYRHEALEQAPLFFDDWKYLPVRNRFEASNMALLLGVVP